MSHLALSNWPNGVSDVARLEEVHSAPSTPRKDGAREWDNSVWNDEVRLLPQCKLARGFQELGYGLLGAGFSVDAH